jgi:hypothetical protein
MIRGTLFLIGAVALAGCAPEAGPTLARETVTVTVGQPSTGVAAGGPSAAARAPAGVYAGNGVWSVGDQPSGGAQRSIPPGRYTLTVTPGKSGGGFVRCSAVVECTLGSSKTLAVEDANGPDYSSVVEIEPTDAAIWLSNVTPPRFRHSGQGDASLSAGEGARA